MGKKGKGKNKPSIATYKSTGQMEKNKIRRMLKHMRVYEDDGIQGTGDVKKFKCPECGKITVFDIIKKRGRGYCKCGYKLKTRKLNEREAKEIWNRDRKRRAA